MQPTLGRRRRWVPVDGATLGIAQARRLTSDQRRRRVRTTAVHVHVRKRGPRVAQTFQQQQQQRQQINYDVRLGLRSFSTLLYNCSVKFANTSVTVFFSVVLLTEN